MSNRFQAISVPFAALALACATTSAVADWTLDPTRSHLTYVTIKAKDVGEVNVFQEMSGRIGGDGRVEVTMALDSVETLVPIRNERMREILFQTANYKDATLTAKIDPAMIDAMAPAEIKTISAEGMLALHGSQQQVTVQVQAAKLTDETIMVASVKPLIVDAEKFGLSEGVEKLRELAGLDSISHAVPVTFVLTFTATE
jgi:polyisoprenoid-binding protein YceI